MFFASSGHFQLFAYLFWRQLSLRFFLVEHGI